MTNPFPTPITPTWLIHNRLTPHQRDFAAHAINQHEKLAGLWAHVETFIEGCCDIVGYRSNDPAGGGAEEKPNALTTKTLRESEEGIDLHPYEEKT